MIRRRYPMNLFQTASAFWLIMIITVAAASPFIAPFDPSRQDLVLQTAVPGTAGHAMGTDELGRDVLSRIMYGSRSALLVGTVAALVSAVAGTLIGLLSALSGRLGDNILMLAMDGLLSIPTVLLAIAVVAFMGYGLTQVMIALGVVYSPVFARLARAETISVKSEYYIEASRALGTNPIRTVYLHILPNIMGPIVVQAAMTFSMAIVVEASLSYLGLGTQPPNASWGLMLKEGRNYLVQAPWLSVFPGLAIAATVLSCNILGDFLAERLNPRRQ